MVYLVVRYPKNPCLSHRCQYLVPSIYTSALFDGKYSASLHFWDFLDREVVLSLSIDN